MHNALRWVHQVVFDHPKQVLTNLHVAISALKGAQFTAVARLGTWLGTAVAAKSTKMKCLQWMLISDKTLGTSCWHWLLAAALSFTHFNYMKTMGALTHWKASGGEKMGAAERQFCGVVSLNAHVSESCLAVAHGDSGLALHSALLQETLFHEVDRLQAIPISIWRSIARVVDMSGIELRDKFLRGASISATYVQRRVLSVFNDLPWFLGSGDMVSNLQEKSQRNSTPSHPVVAKIQTLLQAVIP